ncbi:MAG TPA: hypothetical protein VFR99_01210 [Marmoricola sp.]|nr:hypothetical protein [Marmoricola sp.]
MDTEALADKTFTKARRRDGYEIDEVDRFVGEVRDALRERDQRIGELQGQLAVLRMQAREQAAERTAVPAQQQPEPTPQVDRHESSAAAARLLEIAAENADRLAAESAAEAESVVKAAKAEAESALTAARVEAERVLAEATGRKTVLEGQLETLRQLERSHREKLRQHFNEQLAQLDGNAPSSLRAVD